jgi:hypothetical protein
VVAGTKLQRELREEEGLHENLLGARRCNSSVGNVLRHNVPFQELVGVIIAYVFSASFYRIFPPRNFSDFQSGKNVTYVKPKGLYDSFESATIQAPRSHFEFSEQVVQRVRSLTSR